MAHMRLYHKETGKEIDVWSVDAKELIASGEYSAAAPELGVQEGVPGETVMRPFDPTIHRESPGSRPGEAVVTEPMPGTASTPPTTHTPAEAAASGQVVVPPVERNAAREAAERNEAARKR